MADIKSLISDPDFRNPALSTAGRRQLLAEVDPDFSHLSDDQIDEFINQRAAGGPKSAVEQVGTSLGNTAKGVWDSLQTLGDPHFAKQMGEGIADQHGALWNEAKAAAHVGDWKNALIKGVAAAIPLLGPQAASIGEKLADPNQRWEGMTDLATIPALALATHGAAKSKLATRLSSRQARGAGVAQSMQDTDFRATQLATQALRPAAGDPNWAADVTSALRRVKAAEQRRGYALGDLPKRERLLLPGTAPDYYLTKDILEGALEEGQTLLDRFDTHYLDPAVQQGVTANTGAILSGIRQNISRMETRYPGQAQAAWAEAVRLYGDVGPNGQIRPKLLSATQLQERLRDANAALKTEYAKPEGVTAANVRIHPNTAAKFAEVEGLRDTFYNLLGSVHGETDAVPRSMMREYGKLLTLKEGIKAGINNSLGFEGNRLKEAAPMLGRAAMQASMAESRGAASNAATGAVRLFSPSKGSGATLRDAFKHVKGKPEDWQMPSLGARQGPQGALGPGQQGLVPPQGPGGGWNTQGIPKVGVDFGNPQIGAAPQGQLGPGPPPQLGPGTPQLQGPKIPPQRQISAPPPGPLGPLLMPGQQGGRSMPPAADPSGIKVTPAKPIYDPITGEILRYDSSSGPPEPIAPMARGGHVHGLAGLKQLPSLGHGAHNAPPAPNPGLRQQAAKLHLDRTFAGLAKQNKIAKYGVPAGVLTDSQQGQYNLQLQALQNQPPDFVPPGVQAAVGGQTLDGPKQVVVGEAGREIIHHSDGRPDESVDSPQVRTLGTSGTDDVEPTQPFPKNGIIRGSSDIALSKQGEHEAQALGHQIAAAGGIDKLYTSDLGRTQQTANYIAGPSQAQVMPPNQGLRSWALGDLEGQPVSKETDETIQHHIHAAPDAPLTGSGPISTGEGESFNAFASRAVGALEPIIQEWIKNPQSRIGVITHNRDEKVFRGWITAGAQPGQPPFIDKRELMKSGDEPGSMSRISVGPNGQLKIEDFDPAKDPMEPGVYTIRHLSTDWNAPRNRPEHGS